MALPIRIEGLDGGEAVDLAQALAVRGLVGMPLEAGGQHAVEIHEPYEETERLVAELTAALEAWLADRHRRSVEVRIGEHVSTVGVDDDLPGALRSRLSPGQVEGTANR